MTGQILGGANIMNAVRYQQIITFMVSATTSLGVLSTVYVSLICSMLFYFSSASSANYLAIVLYTPYD